MLRTHNSLVLASVSIALLVAVSRPGAAATATGDSLYNALHPRLLFTSDELPDLRAKVSDGGYDDDAYEFVRILAENSYANSTLSQLMGNYSGLSSIPNLGLAAHLATPLDTASIRIGRDLTVYIAENFDVDGDEANSGLRLRALALGYDMFFADAPDSVRALVRDEIISYMTCMTTDYLYKVMFTWRPYLANHSAMFAGPLGMASICLRDEVDPELLDNAMDQADALIDSLLTYQFDPGGVYKEGCLYGAWTMRQLVYYFHARKRFDGFDYAAHPIIRAVENWFAYEVLPVGHGKTNNLNDSSYFTAPLPLHGSYLDWAQWNWSSGLSAWIWEHTSGPYGIDYYSYADKAATVLWNTAPEPLQPDSILPPSQLWEDGGLFYYRTGWQSGLDSRDVVLSFYSGKFHGGHAQEDQNSFTLYAYGEKFAIDHGPGRIPKQSESHNIVFVDGAGQHNAGSSIGTDGRIESYLLSDFADYVMGDATAAYTTYSEFNAPGWPFSWCDWSWGYVGANPVLHARRRLFVVRDAGTPPFFIITDDMDKDGSVHEYEWRLHTFINNTVDISTNPIRIGAASADLDVHLLFPDFSETTLSTEDYFNEVMDPNSTLLKLAYNGVNPRFAVLLFPFDATVAAPVVSRELHPWGYVCRLDWGGGVRDVIIGNHSGGTVSWGPDSLLTDASVAIVRTEDAHVIRHLLVDATVFAYDGVDHVRFFDASATCALDGDVVQIDRGDAVFSFLDTGIEGIECRGESIPFVSAAGYLFSESVVASEGEPVPQALSVSVYPNPFNPTVSVRIETTAGSRVRASVYDASGSLVGELMDATTTTNVTTIRWDARNRSGKPVASGIYFLKVSAKGYARTEKLVVVR